MKKLLAALALVLFAAEASAVVIHARVNLSRDNYDLYVGGFELFRAARPNYAPVHSGGPIGVLDPADEFDFSVLDSGQVIRVDVTTQSGPAFIDGVLTLPPGVHIFDNNQLFRGWTPTGPTRRFPNEILPRASYITFIRGIPEPQTWALMASGLMLAGFVVRRRMK